MKRKIENILLSVIFIFLTHVPDLTSAIKCYQCFLTKPIYYQPNETLRLCSEFDYSEKFIVDCPYSTFCMKKSFSAKLPVPINGTERDCAFQKYDTQNYKNGKWQPEVHIEEPYKEGCYSQDKSEGLRTADVQFCYCKWELCNSSGVLKYSIYLIFLSVIAFIVNSNFIVFNI